VNVYVCSTCSTDGAFVDVVREGMPKFAVHGVECMSGCARAQTVAFRQTGKVAYLFGDITDDDMDDLRRFARLYEASTDGTFPDARVLGNLRLKALARIPG
jgi:predicted metal-binding protein